jgi:hypothetical protein
MFTNIAIGFTCIAIGILLEIIVEELYNNLRSNQ